MKWEILILTQPERNPWLQELLAALSPQIKGRDIGVTVENHLRCLPVGDNRQRMLAASKGEYVNFVDDDDMVSDNYVAEIYPHLGFVDCVTFRMDIVGVGGWRSSFTPLALGESERTDGYCRDILHLSPLRRKIATAFPMEGGQQEDIRWARRIRGGHLIASQHDIGKPLYTYYPTATRPWGPLGRQIERERRDYLESVARGGRA